jgi:hypothetical protein
MFDGQKRFVAANTIACKNFGSKQDLAVFIDCSPSGNFQVIHRQKAKKLKED